MGQKQKLILFLIIFICTAFQVLPLIRSGLPASYGLGFWGPNGHDMIWHLSLINHISNPFKIPFSTYSGSMLSNYHPFYDILIKFLSYITHIPAILWIFQIFPLISSFIFLFLSFRVGLLITKSYRGGIYLILLNSFASSFGWIATLIKSGTFGGESIFWSMQSASNQLNPPYLLSLIFLLLLFYILEKQRQNQSKFSVLQLTVIAIIVVLSPVTKAYSAIPIFSLVFVYALNYIRQTKKLSLLLTFFTSAVASLVLFLNYNPASSGLLIYKPFWFVNSMIESKDRIYIPKLANARYFLEATGHLGPRLLAVYLITFAIFIVGNFSWRLLGLATLFKKPNLPNLIFLFNILFLILIPTLFIQKGTSWNTIQFLYYALFLSNLLLCQFLSKSVGKLFIVIIFISFILSNIDTYRQFLGKIPPAALVKSEITPLNFLNHQPPGIVLTYPYDKFMKQSFSSTPIPLYAYETTAYIPAFTNQLTYLSDEMNVDNSGLDVATRKDTSTKFFEQTNQFEDRGFLVNNHIDYIYLTGLQLSRTDLNVKNLYLTPLYSDGNTLIYRVNR